jgi:NitT/TauT family transport system substrate-binding protein
VRRRFVLSLLVISAACAVWRPAEAQQQKVVVAQSLQSPMFLPLYVAVDKGFFAKRGLDVQIYTSGSGANSVASLIAGTATFAFNDPMTTVLATQKGASLHLVGNVGNQIAVWLVVKDGSPIRSIEDLRGKTIATTIPPSTAPYVLQQLLTRNHVDATLQKVMQGAELASLMAGKADAATLFEPTIESAVAQGCRVLYEFTSAAPKGFAFNAISVSDETIRKQPQTVQSFVDAIAEANRSINSDPSGATEVALHAFPSLPPDQIRRAVGRLAREHVFPQGALLDEAQFENAVQLQLAIGNMKGTVRYGDFVDPSFAMKAKP